MYKQRDIIMIPFPYTDLTETKQRPAIIVSNNNYNDTLDDVVVCAVTSKFQRDEFCIELLDTNLDYGKLPEISFVKAHKLLTIHKSKIIKKYSRVKEDYFSTIQDRIADLIEP
jgi:mRNA interferase MazF